MFYMIRSKAFLMSRRWTFNPQGAFCGLTLVDSLCFLGSQVLERMEEGKEVKMEDWSANEVRGILAKGQKQAFSSSNSSSSGGSIS